MNKPLLLNSVEVIVDTHELIKNKIMYITTGTWVDFCWDTYQQDQVFSTDDLEKGKWRPGFFFP